MISPVAQRQAFQNANIEAIRAAQEVGEHLQKEAASRQAADQKMTESAVEVHRIGHSENIRAEERKEGRRQAREGNSHSGEGEPESGQETTESAGPADSHLDLLA